MRVVHLISPGQLAGAERVVLHGVAALQRAGVGVTLGVFVEGRAPQHAERFLAAAYALGISQTLALPCRGRLDPSLISRLRSLGTRDGWDVVHCHGYKPLSYASLVVRLLPHQPVLVATHHGDTGHSGRVSAYERLATALYRMTDVVIAVSPGVERELLSRGLSADRLARVDNLVALRAAAPSSAASGAPTDNDAKRRGGLVTVGRLSVEKGLDVLVEALRRLGPAAPHLDVIGDGPEMARLVESARGLDVAFHGWVDDIAPWLNGADALVQPSRREGLPLTVLESLAAGTPVIATRVGGMPDVVRSGHNGLLVSPDDVGGLAEAIVTLGATLDALRRTAAAEAPALALRYGSDRWAAETLDIYSERIAHRRAPGTVSSGRPAWVRGGSGGGS